LHKSDQLSDIVSYYPILKAPDCRGWTTLCNFSPNNWESKDFSEKFMNVTWAENGAWRSESIGMLAPDAIRTINIEEVSGIVSQGALPLLSLSKSKLPVRSEELPLLDIPKTILPAWRATLGLSTPSAQTSFQGELDPFPLQGTLLTFGPFVQFGVGIKNYLILLNIENSAVSRSADVEIYDAAGLKLRRRFLVSNNAANFIQLDELGFEHSDLPLFICRGMAAIPLYFSSAMDGAYLSLEHTHPPASLVVHGRRWEAQKILKNRWFAKVTP
jgi:hypothetical protein